MFCPFCGAAIESSSLEFCPSCLGTVRGPQSPAAAASAPPQPVLVTQGFEAETAPEVPAVPCPRHPAMPVGGSCARCGAFVCIQCDPELAQTTKPSCPECRAREEAPTQGRGLGGWLVVPTLNVTFAIFAHLAQLVRSVISLAGAQATTSRSLELVTTLHLVDAVSFSLTVGYSVFAITCLWNHKRSAPPVMIGFYAWMVVLCVLQLVVLHALLPKGMGSSSQALDAQALRTGRAVLSAAIWIPYFLFSKRVQQTFVVG